MRFKRWPRPTACEDTSRKRAAYRRKQVREQAALPLFAAAIAERQLPVDEEMIRRTGQWERQQQQSRRQRAEVWLRARARLFALEVDQRRVIRALWRICPYPADPSYLGTLLHEIATGRIDPVRPPWGGRHTLTRRTTRGRAWPCRPPPSGPAPDAAPCATTSCSRPAGGPKPPCRGLAAPTTRTRCQTASERDP